MKREGNWIEFEKGIWLNLETNTHSLEDETHDFVGEYKSIGEAKREQQKYIKEQLGG